MDRQAIVHAGGFRPVDAVCGILPPPRGRALRLMGSVGRPMGLGDRKVSTRSNCLAASTPSGPSGSCIRPDRLDPFGRPEELQRAEAESHAPGGERAAQPARLHPNIFSHASPGSLAFLVVQQASTAIM